MEEERDFVTFTDEDGSDFELDVIDYFDYKGDEYAILVDTEGCPDCDCDCANGEDEECGHEANIYIMKIIVNEEDDTEEFVPPADEDMDELIGIAQQKLEDEDNCCE